jgi:polycomb protein SUZ12
MYEMTNEMDNKFYSVLEKGHKPATKLFYALPIIKFQIDLKNIPITNFDCNNILSKFKLNNNRANIKFGTQSSSSSTSSSLYQSPLSSPVADIRKKRKYFKINNNKKSIDNTSFQVINENLDLYYQFIGKNNIKVLTKFNRNKDEIFVCPFCYVNCKFIDSLLKHLSSNHFRFQVECIVSRLFIKFWATLFSFLTNCFFFSFKPATLTPTVSKIQLNIIINDLYNGSYLGNCYDAHSAYGYSLARHQPTRRIPVTFIYVCKKTNLDYSNDANDINALNEIKSMSSTNGLEKLFYHPKTCSTIYTNELNQDSDNELDPEWLQEQTGLFIQEFADVNQGEKEIMRLWNLHIIHNNFISDAQVFNACETFIEKCGTYILSNNLLNNFYLHLANLNDYGLLEASKIAKLCDLLFENDIKK